MARKPLTIPKLIKKLDRVFSKYIRLNAADSNGMVSCCSCSKQIHWKKAHAGHFAARTHGNTRFSVANVHPQCCYCNTFSAGNPAGYALYMKQKYGEGIIETINNRAKTPMKWDRSMLLMEIDLYTQKVKQLQKEKGLY